MTRYLKSSHYYNSIFVFFETREPISRLVRIDGNEVPFTILAPTHLVDVKSIKGLGQF
jgi:hypothetical protein